MRQRELVKYGFIKALQVKDFYNLRKYEIKEITDNIDTYECSDDIEDTFLVELSCFKKGKRTSPRFITTYFSKLDIREIFQYKDETLTAGEFIPAISTTVLEDIIAYLNKKINYYKGIDHFYNAAVERLERFEEMIENLTLLPITKNSDVVTVSVDEINREKRAKNRINYEKKKEEERETLRKIRELEAEKEERLKEERLKHKLNHVFYTEKFFRKYDFKEIHISMFLKDLDITELVILNLKDSNKNVMGKISYYNMTDGPFKLLCKMKPNNSIESNILYEIEFKPITRSITIKRPSDYIYELVSSDVGSYVNIHNKDVLVNVAVKSLSDYRISDLLELINLIGTRMINKELKLNFNNNYVGIEKHLLNLNTNTYIEFGDINVKALVKNIFIIQFENGLSDLIITNGKDEVRNISYDAPTNSLKMEFFYDLKYNLTNIDTLEISKDDKVIICRFHKPLLDFDSKFRYEHLCLPRSIDSIEDLIDFIEKINKNYKLIDEPHYNYLNKKESL